MAEGDKKEFMGPKDETRDKAKSEALKKVGPSKVSLELKARQAALQKEAESRQGKQGLVVSILIVGPIAALVYSFFMEDKQMALMVLKWSVVLLFTLAPAYLILKAVLFRKSTF